jgi:hypothetical protein
MSDWETTITAHTINLSELFIGIEASISFAESDSGTGRSSYALAWTDGLANAWTEHYPELHQALARVALLAFIDVESTGSGLDRSFSDIGSNFAQHADAFVQSRTNR